MRNLFTIAVASLTLLLFTAPTSAQMNSQNAPVQRGPIYGTVLRQSDNVPLPRVKVTLSTNSGDPVDTQFTSMDGKFAFGGLQFGSYVLEVDAEGYEHYRDGDVQLLERLGTGVVVMMRDINDKPAAPGAMVSTREMSLPQKAQDELHKGMDALFQKHDAAGSLAYFQKVLDLSPAFYEATYYEGVAYLKLNKMPEAEAAFRKAIDASDHHFAEPCISLASMLDDKRDYADAEPFAQESADLNPDDWRAQYQLARALLGLGRFADAEKSGLEAKRLKPDFGRLYLVLADIHLQLHKNEAVLDDVNSYLKLEPTGPYSQQAKALKQKTEEALKQAPAPPAQ
jgi:tetratricopeptide (TPR) repeat protein